MTVFTIESNKYYNLVAAGVSPGTVLKFEVEPDQTWWDAHIECGADGHGADHPFWQAISRTLARSKEAPLFRLMGCICECDLPPNDECLFQVGERYVVGGDPAKKYCVYLFANDVSGFYWNNRGRIRVRIH